MNKICTIVVTFNRLTLLKSCIEAIALQTTTVNKIIIVDNNSTDGTKEWLQNLQKHNIECIFQDNEGGAGGFHTGIKAAYEQGFEWIWVMDDDVEPTETCLSELLKYKEISKCLHPIKKYTDGNTFEWQHIMIPHTGEKIILGNYLFKRDNPICFMNVANFEGMLIHRSIVEQIGYPHKHYFIVDDDTEYGYRASYYTNVSYIRDAILIRKKKKSEEKETSFYLYYKYRNKFLLMRDLRNNPNYSFSKKRFLYQIIKDTFEQIKTLRESKDHEKKSKTKAVIKGFWDGIRKRKGKTD